MINSHAKPNTCVGESCFDHRLDDPRAFEHEGKAGRTVQYDGKPRPLPRPRGIRRFLRVVDFSVGHPGSQFRVLRFSGDAGFVRGIGMADSNRREFDEEGQQRGAR